MECFLSFFIDIRKYDFLPQILSPWRVLQNRNEFISWEAQDDKGPLHAQMPL